MYYQNKMYWYTKVTTLNYILAYTGSCIVRGWLHQFSHVNNVKYWPCFIKHDFLIVWFSGRFSCQLDSMFKLFLYHFSYKVVKEMYTHIDRFCYRRRKFGPLQISEGILLFIQTNFHHIHHFEWNIDNISQGSWKNLILNYLLKKSIRVLLLRNKFLFQQITRLCR